MKALIIVEPTEDKPRKIICEEFKSLCIINGGEMALQTSDNEVEIVPLDKIQFCEVTD